MNTPRYSILPTTKDGVTRYMFRDHREPTPETIVKGVTYGTAMLFFKSGFFTMENAADAVAFCRYLNEEDAKAPFTDKKLAVAYGSPEHLQMELLRLGDEMAAAHKNCLGSYPKALAAEWDAATKGLNR